MSNLFKTKQTFIFLNLRRKSPNSASFCCETMPHPNGTKGDLEFLPSVALSHGIQLLLRWTDCICNTQCIQKHWENSMQLLNYLNFVSMFVTLGLKPLVCPCKAHSPPLSCTLFWRMSFKDASGKWLGIPREDRNPVLFTSVLCFPVVPLDLICVTLWHMHHLWAQI